MEEDSHAIEAGLLCLGGQRRSTERKEYQYRVTPPPEAARKKHKYGDRQGGEP